MDPGPGVEVVVGGREPVQFDGVDAGGAGGVDPFDAGEQGGLVARLAETLAQRDRGKGVPGIRPGDHGDAHRPYPATALGGHARPSRYAGNHDRADRDSAVANTRTVEGFLNALQDEDFDTAEAALDDNLVYENVGLPTIHGRRQSDQAVSPDGGPRRASR